MQKKLFYWMLAAILIGSGDSDLFPKDENRKRKSAASVSLCLGF